MKVALFSLLYRLIRRHTLSQIYARQESQGKSRDLEDAIEIGDRWLKRLPHWLYSFNIPQGIGATLYNLEFPSPLTLSSFKDDLDVIAIWMQLGLGGACIKTVMKEPRQGNPRPRLQEVHINGHDGLFNAMGLPGKGVGSVADALPTSRLFSLGRPIGISIGGSSIDEYLTNFNQISHVLRDAQRSYPWQTKPPQYYFEVNISCPNTPEGQQMSRNHHLLEGLLAYMREGTDNVIGVKLSPDMHDYDLLCIADRIKNFQKTYVNLGNTTYRKCEEVGLSQEAISMGGGGLSGPTLYDRTLRMTMLIRNIGIPIIATGGVDSSRKVKELLNFGATLVGMATAVVQDMYCIPKINYELGKNRLT